MDGDGANKTKLTLPNESMYLYPSWSPDGTKIAFECRSYSGRPDVVVMNADGSDVAILTANTGSSAFPQWSPKGDRIVFVSSEDGKTGISVIILDEKWKSASSEAIASLPNISHGSWKKAYGFSISVAMIAFLIVFVLQKRK